MKLLIFAGLLLILHLASSSVVRDHFAHVPMSDVAASIFRTCVKKTGASQEDIVGIQNFEYIHATKEAKCWLACAADSYGLFDNAGALVINSVDLYLSAQFEPQERERALAIWMGCYAKVMKSGISEKCEFIFILSSCFMDQVNQEGVKKIKYF